MTAALAILGRDGGGRDGKLAAAWLAAKRSPRSTRHYDRRRRKPDRPPATCSPGYISRAH